MKNGKCKTDPWTEEAAEMGEKQYKARMAGKKPSGPPAAKAAMKGKAPSVGKTMRTSNIPRKGR